MHAFLHYLMHQDRSTLDSVELDIVNVAPGNGALEIRSAPGQYYSTPECRAPRQLVENYRSQNEVICTVRSAVALALASVARGDSSHSHSRRGVMPTAEGQKMDVKRTLMGENSISGGI